MAIPLGNTAKDKLAAIQQEMEKSSARVKLVEKENLHMTLRFVGDDKPERWIRKIGQIREKPFSIVLDRIGAFPDEKRVRVLWAGCEPVESLLNIHRVIGGGELIPHITLARIKGKPDDVLLGMLNKKIRVDVAVKGVVLINSTLTPSGPSYKVLHEKTL